MSDAQGGQGGEVYQAERLSRSAISPNSAVRGHRHVLAPGRAAAVDTHLQQVRRGLQNSFVAVIHRPVVALDRAYARRSACNRLIAKVKRRLGRG